MSVQNSSSQAITVFVIGGFDTVQSPLLVGVVLLILYILVILANIANMYLIIMDKHLYQPMFLFICNLAVVDIVYCTTACPTMIAILVVGYKSMSYAQCIVQMFFHNVGAAMEMLAICVMSFDRFIAISSPLRYHSILTNLRCILIIIFLWLTAFAVLTIFPASVLPLQVCYSSVKYMFCDFASVIRTTCVDPESYFNNISILTSVLTFGTFSFILLSYVNIVIVIVRMPSKNDKKKAFNTCFSHLIVIVCYYAPMVIRVVLTRIGLVLTIEQRNGMTIGGMIGPSLINPFIYSLRTKEIRNNLLKILPNLEPALQN